MVRKKENTLKCVVLFDIDGTLLAGPDFGPSAGLKAMGQALTAVAGISCDYNSVEFAGRTDEQIGRALLEKAGLKEPSKEDIDLLISHYVSFLQENVKAMPYRVIGRPEEAVLFLRAREAIAELGTGNVRRGAKIKLENAGIGHMFDYDKGGFGDGAGSRAELLELGAGKCDPTRSLPVIIVGDTPHDIKAAHEIGGACVGIPYGHNDSQTLIDAGADAMIDTIDVSLVEAVESCVRILESK